MEASRPRATSRHIKLDCVEHRFFAFRRSAVVEPQVIGEIPQVKGPILLFIAAFGHQQHFAELNHSRERRAPFSKQRKIVDKPTQRLVDLIEPANHDH